MAQTQEFKEILRRNLPYLKENMSEDCISKCVDLLFSMAIFTAEQSSSIRSKATREEKCHSLIDNLMTNTKEGYQTFLEGLENPEFRHIKDKLDSTDEGYGAEACSFYLYEINLSGGKRSTESLNTAAVMRLLIELQDQMQSTTRKIDQISESQDVMTSEVNSLRNFVSHPENMEYKRKYEDLQSTQQGLRDKIIDMQKRLFTLNMEHEQLKKESESKKIKDQSQSENVQLKIALLKEKNTDLERKIYSLEIQIKAEKETSRTIKLDFTKLENDCKILKEKLKKEMNKSVSRSVIEQLQNARKFRY